MKIVQTFLAFTGVLYLSLSVTFALDGYVLMTKVGTNEYGTGDLYLKNTGTGTSTRIASGAIFATCFSPDGQNVAFIKDGSIYTMPSIGGTATLIYSGTPSVSRQPGLSWDENDNLWWSSDNTYDRVFYVKAQPGASLQEKTFSRIECNGASGCKGVISLQVCRDGTKGASWARPYIAAQGGADGTMVTFNFTNGTTKYYNPMCMGAISPSGTYVSVNHEDHMTGTIKYYSSGSNYKSITCAPSGYKWTGFRWSRHSEYHLMYVTESPSVKTYILDIRDNSKIHLGDGYRAWDYYNGSLDTGNLPPSVSITAPSAGLVTGVDSTVTITATASDDGSVAFVEFFTGSTSLGTDNSAPYSTIWVPAAAGSYSLTAVATDDSGLTTTSSAVSVTVQTAPGVRSPYGGTAWAIPGKIQCEDFDNGGEGVAYHDITDGNRDGAYRTDVDVDIKEGGGSEGYFVTSTDVEEWISWSVDVAENNYYALTVKAANGTDAGRFHVELDGNTIAGVFFGQSTGGYTVWEDQINVAVQLTAGAHVLKLVVDEKGYIFDYVEFKQAVEVITPADGTTYRVGDPLRITWNTVPAVVNDVHVELSTGGDTWGDLTIFDRTRSISDTDPAWKDWTWTIKEGVPGLATLASDSCRIRVRLYGGTVCDISDGYFSITSDNTVIGPTAVPGIPGVTIRTAGGQVTISAPVDLHFTSMLSDMNGQKVTGGSYLNPTLDCSAVPAGVYLLQIKTREVRMTRKILINW